jgi:hypothetical protein
MTLWSAGSIPRTAFIGAQAVGGVQNWQTSAGTIYYGPTPSSNDIGVAVLPGGGGTATTAATITVPGVTAWTAVGGNVFYTDVTAVHKYDTVTKATSVYAGVGVTLTAVTK